MLKGNLSAAGRLCIHEGVEDADHHRDPARDALGGPQQNNAMGTVEMKGLWIRIQQALSAPLNARGALLWLASQSINIALPLDGRWIEVLETRLPDGRQAFQAIEYPGQQSVTGVPWQILAWIQGRIST